MKSSKNYSTIMNLHNNIIDIEYDQYFLNIDLRFNMQYILTIQTS